ncbi:hypothetical protein Ndes2526B_g05870 [Nannochloris sp. 'desiccata']
MVIISSCQVKAVRSAKTSHNYSKIYNNTQLGDTTVRNRSFGSSFGNKLALLKLTELPARSICAANSQHKDSSVASPKCSADETKSEEHENGGNPLNHVVLRTTLLALAAASATYLVPLAAHAVETAPEGFFEAIITTIEGLGPLGPVAFIATVAIAESIPLMPTQPLSLASGLLFGTQKGAACMLVGTTLASLIAFTVARGVGRPLAEKILRHEMKGVEVDDEGNAVPSTNGFSVQAKLMEATVAIENGSLFQQTFAVFVLRMTPFIPFSASNYMLGLSPLPMTPYVTGTVAGMFFWSCIYASFGGASRALLRRGADPDALLGDLLQQVGSVSQEVARVALIAGGVSAAVWGVMYVKRKIAAQGSQQVDS